MKPGDVFNWLDQGPVILLKRVQIYDPIRATDLDEEGMMYEDWPSEPGWLIKVLLTGEYLEVHDETLREIE